MRVEVAEMADGVGEEERWAGPAENVGGFFVMLAGGGGVVQLSFCLGEFAEGFAQVELVVLGAGCFDGFGGGAFGCCVVAFAAELDG